MKNFVDDILLTKDPEWEESELTKVPEEFSEAKHIRLNLGEVNKGTVKVPLDQAVYFVCVTDPKMDEEIKTRILINGTAWVRNTFGQAGDYVDKKIFKDENGKRKTFKSESSIKRWLDTPSDLYESLLLGGYKDSKEDFLNTISSVISKHKTNLVKIGQAKSLAGRMSGYTNPKFPMTKSLLGPGLMEYVELVGFLGVDLRLEGGMIYKYSTVYGVRPVWEQR